MNDDNNRLRSLDHLDTLIDRALASYTPREPRPGLTERVLRSQATEAAVNRLWSRTYKPIWALAAAAALLAVAVIPLWFKSAPPAIVVAQRPRPATEPAQLATAFLEPENPARSAGAVFARDVTSKSAAHKSAARSEPDSEPEARLARMPETDESLNVAPIVIRPIAMTPIRIAAN
jgi:hypothetical protein